MMHLDARETVWVLGVWGTTTKIIIIIIINRFETKQSSLASRVELVGGNGMDGMGWMAGRGVVCGVAWRGVSWRAWRWGGRGSSFNY